MKGTPLGTNVRIKIEEIASNAMVMVDEKESRTEKATVLEVGNEVTTVNVGDVILFKAYNLDEIEIDDEKYVIIPEEDIKYLWSKTSDITLGACDYMCEREGNNLGEDCKDRCTTCTHHHVEGEDSQCDNCRYGV